MNNGSWIGNFTKAPVLTTVGDKQVCNFTIAISNGKDREAVYIPCAVWNSDKHKAASNLVKYCQPVAGKQRQIGIEGELASYKPKPKDDADKPENKLFVRVRKATFVGASGQEQIEVVEDEVPFDFENA